MKRPKWLKPLLVKEENLRRVHGLTAKRDGWYKSVAGKTRYIAKPMPVAQAVDILAARSLTGELVGTSTIRVNPATMSIEELVETFLAAMLLRKEGKGGKKLERRTYQDYVEVLSRFCAAVGCERLAARIGPADFSRFIATISHRPPSTRRREIQYVDRLFNWAGPGKKSMNLIPFAVRGPDWIKPGDAELSIAGDDADKAYSIEQIRAAFEKAKAEPLALAAGHLGFGSGFIPDDITKLPENAVDLDAGIIIFRRGKTGISRMCPLMPDAVDALRAYLKVRPKKCNDSALGLFFRTIYGNPMSIWFEGEKTGPRKENRISRVWKRVTELPFTGLRSTFATLVDDWTDQRAIDVVLGHSSGKKGRHIRTRHYAKKFKPERARAVVRYAYAQAFEQQSPSTEPGRSAA